MAEQSGAHKQWPHLSIVLPGLWMEAMDADWPAAIERARRYAPFLARGLDRLPELAALLMSGDGGGALGYARSAGGKSDDVGQALRRERLALAVTLAVGDLAGAFPLARVMGELSTFADRALDAAILAAIRRRAPDADSAGFVALALGKHGAGELNYSSDIDPILLYDPRLLARRARDEPGEAAQRVARTVIELLAGHTADGYVFRVDLRLRPAAEVSPLAIGFDAALPHYESSALAWERAAFIRARSAAGDVAAGTEFLAAIRPFVWRKSLDFGAIDDIAKLTARIRADYDGPLRPGPGFDLKKGRGGIREVEFFAQTHQLIHGGRNPALRVRGTRAALDALADAGIVGRDDAHILGESYDRLRTVEHRLQMVADQQTHSLPVDGTALDGVARLDGMGDGAALVEELAAITAAVAVRFDRLVEPDSAGTPAPTLPDGAALIRLLRDAGMPDAEEHAARIAGWRDGKVRSLRSAAARAAFDAIAPELFAALAQAPDPARALTRFEALLIKLPSAVNLFRLLEARPALLDQLVAILILAPPLADELSRRPELLDTLIDRSAFDLPGDVEGLAARMRGGDPDADYEALLDRVRRIVGETRFTLGVQLINAARDPLEISAALARVAEAALVVCVDAAEAEFAHKYGRIAGGDLIVLGLGRFGGGALTHASDLDLIFLFTDTDGARSDGARALGATHYFNRLAQRVSAALSVPTAEGALYDVDTRLRPQGAQGPLAVSLDSFARYQTEAAWTWEHMALTRARPLAGPAQGQAAVTAIVRAALQQDRAPAALKAAVLEMRTDMAAHKPAAGPLDAKLLRGGLVDLEFLVHFLQLRDGIAFDPDLQVAIKLLMERGLLSAAVPEAAQFLARLLVAARMLASDGVEPPPSAGAALVRACRQDDMAGLLQSLAAARHAVAASWCKVFGQTLEIE